MIKKTTKFFITFIAMVLLFSTVSYDFANAQETSVKSSESDNIDKEAKKLQKDIDPFFTLLDKLPEDIANSGIDKSIVWMNQNKGPEFNGYVFVNENGNLKLNKIASSSNNMISYSVAGCVSAITLALVQNAIPWTKILKVKKAAKAAGGLQKMAKRIVTVYQHQRNLGLKRTTAIKKAVSIASRTFPADARQALIELVGLGGVSAACFS